MPQSEGVGDSRVGLKDTEICRLPKATEGQILKRGANKWGVEDDCAYFEQIVPLAVNVTKEITPVAGDKDFIADNTRAATKLKSTDDTKVQSVFLHITGIAVNTYTYSNGLDCSAPHPEYNQWQINLDGGAYSDLVNVDEEGTTFPDGQMLDNDWRCPLEGSIPPFHLMFDVTDQYTTIAGKLGIRLKDGKSQQSSLWVTANMFLRILWKL